MDAISCLAPPPALLPTNVANAAIARALHLSTMSSDSASSTSSLSAPYQHHSPLLGADHLQAAYPPHVTTCDSVLVADSAPGGRRQKQQQQQLAPAGRRAGKRRSRASKRAPTTYISTDPANFRITVQQITGVQAEPGDMETSMLLLQPTSTSALDAVLLASGAAAAYGNGNPLVAVPGGGDEASAALGHEQQLQLHQQQPCFPTLDSWNVMYERSELL